MEGDGVHPSGALADPILTAVDDNGLAGNECGIVGCEEQSRSSNILGFSPPLDCLLFPGGTSLLFRLRCGGLPAE